MTPSPGSGRRRAALVLAASACSMMMHGRACAAVAYVTHGGLGSVTVIDTDRDVLTRTLRVDGGLGGVAVAPDGRRVFILSGHSSFHNKTYANGLTEVDARSGKTVRVVELPGPGGEVAIGPDGRSVYTAHQGRIIETPTEGGSAPRTFLFPAMDATAIAVSPDGARLALADPESDGVLLIDARTHAAIARLPVCAEPGGLAWSPDGRRLYVIDSQHAKLDLVSLAKRAVIASVETGKGPTAVAVTPDGRKIYVSDAGVNLGEAGAPRARGAVTVIDANPFRVRATVDVGEHPLGLAITPDGHKVYVVATLGRKGSSKHPDGGRDSTISVIDTRTDRVIKTIAVGEDAFVSGDFIGRSPPAN